MRCGLFLPVSGRSATRDTLRTGARQAEAWGFDSVWAADRTVIPWQIETTYPYNESASFFVPPDRPFLEALTTIAFLADCTERIRLGVSVVVLPYRNPLYWAKRATTIAVLSEGHFDLGVGIGWMVEEFEALGAPFEHRGPVADEHLGIWKVLTTEDHCTFEGRFHSFPSSASNRSPSAARRSRSGSAARAVRHGAAPGASAMRGSPVLSASHPRSCGRGSRRCARSRPRRSGNRTLNCCLPIEVTAERRRGSRTR